jgi:F420-dependent oxidoreductase-like protein
MPECKSIGDGMTLKVGLMLPQEWDKEHIDPISAYEMMTSTAQEAEALGFTSVWLFDHVHSTTSDQIANRMIFECWTSTAALARDTKRIRIGQLVTCNGFRNPALLAKMASTVDVLSHGRLDLGIGAGWYEQEYHAYGYPFPETPVRLRQLRETLQILHSMWTEEEASFEGQYTQIHHAINQPKGIQKPHIPIMIGGKGEQGTLRLLARYGDACNFTHPTPQEIEHKFLLIQRYCENIGRDYHTIRRTIYVNGFLAESDAKAIEKLAHYHSKFSVEQGLLGNPDTLRHRLSEIEQLGVQEVIVFLPDVTDKETLHLLAQCIHY